MPYLAQVDVTTKNSGPSEAITYVLFAMPWVSIYKVIGGPKSPSGGGSEVEWLGEVGEIRTEQKVEKIIALFWF